MPWPFVDIFQINPNTNDAAGCLPALLVWGWLCLLEKFPLTYIRS